MKYSFTGRIRYSETDQDARLTLDGLINYFQDCSLFHSMEVDMGVDYLEEKKQAWMLTGWQIIINDMPKLGDEVRTSTWANEFRKCNGGRNFTMENQEGELLAYANSYWCYIDMVTGRPTPFAEADGEKYQPEPPMDMECAPKKIAWTGDGTAQKPYRILAHHIDTNHHVNNGQYVLMAMSYLPESFKIRQMRAEYKRQAKLDDLITPVVHMEDGKCLVALCNDKEKPYAIVEFQE
ncbi:MAG: thioesterase [Lachnospiraceae bacterium]|nr:thioesterase [Lachnospiraceae bacterium]